MREKDLQSGNLPSSKNITDRKNKGGSLLELPPTIARCFAAAIPCYEKTVCSVGKLTLRFSFIGNRVWEGL